jgi:hypothetical protein
MAAIAASTSISRDPTTPRQDHCYYPAVHRGCRAQRSA